MTAPAPAPAPAPPVPSPAGPADVRSAAAAALAALAVPAVPAATDSDPSLAKPPADGEHHSKDQPRDDAGKFTDPAKAEADLDAAKDPKDPAAEAVADPDAKDGEDAAADPALLVVIPGRQPDEQIEIEVESPETAERLRQLVNSSMRSAEARAAIADATRIRDEAQYRLDRVSVDPVASLLGDRPVEDVKAVILSALAQPGVFEAIREELDSWVDPSIERARRAELRSDYVTGRDARESELEDRRFTAKTIGAYHHLIGALTPPNLPDEAKTLFARDAMNDIYLAAQNSKDGLIHPRHVASVLAPRLKGFGLTDEQIAAALVRARGGDPSAPPAPPRPERVRRTGKQLVDASAAKRAAAAPGPGAGAQVARIAFNPTDTVADRIKAMSQKPA